jgi:hypothetical protein
MAIADQAQEIANGINPRQSIQAKMPAGDLVRNPAPGAALLSGDPTYKAPGPNPPRNIITEGTPRDIPDPMNVRSPAP